MKHVIAVFAATWTCLCFWLCMPGARAGDVVGYSVVKGQFFLQTAPNVVFSDVDFAYSLQVWVGLADFNRLRAGSFSPPGGRVQMLDDLGDHWGALEVRRTFESLNSDFGWGAYTINFETVNDGSFSCALQLPESPFPPVPRLTNFGDVQAVDATRPLAVMWEFSQPPQPDDFVQVYVTLGNATIFSTPGLGEVGALDGTSRSLTIPSGTLKRGFVYGLNLEITRVASVNSECYPGAGGQAAKFSGTGMDLTTILPPQLRLLSRPANRLISLEVLAEPNATVVLQGSEDLMRWTDRATNSAPDGTNLFSVSAVAPVMEVFRARLQ